MKIELKKQTFLLSIAKFSGKFNSFRTLLGFPHPLPQHSYISSDEQILRNQISVIYQDGASPENIKRILELYDTFCSNEPISYHYYVNLARFLALAGMFSKAEDITNWVIEDFSHNNNALCEALEVKAFILEFFEPENKYSLEY